MFSLHIVGLVFSVMGLASPEREIRQIIDQSLAATKSGDAEKFVEAMTEDVLIIDENRMWNRSEIQGFAKSMRISSYQISEVTFKQLSETSCTYTYRNNEVGTFEKSPFKLDLYITTVWVKREGNWKVVLIHETNVKTPSKVSLSKSQIWKGAERHRI